MRVLRCEGAKMWGTEVRVLRCGYRCEGAKMWGTEVRVLRCGVQK